MLRRNHGVALLAVNAGGLIGFSPPTPRCPNHSSVRVPRACGHQSIQAQTIIPFVFQEHAVTRASMPKALFRSCSKSMRSPEHPCPNHYSVRVPRACGHQSIHAQTIIPFVFQEHAVTRAPMPKPLFRSCSKSMRSPEHPCSNHYSVRVPRVCGHQRIHAQTTIPFVLQEHAVTRASMPKALFRSCSRSMRSPEHPCPNHKSVCVPHPCRSCSKSMWSPEHPCLNHNSVRVPRAYGARQHPCPSHGSVRVPRAGDHQRIHAQTIIPCVFQEHTVTGASALLAPQHVKSY